MVGGRQTFAELPILAFAGAGRTKTVALAAAATPSGSPRPEPSRQPWHSLLTRMSILPMRATAASARRWASRAHALDLGPLNITVNRIGPGPFATEMPMSILQPEQQAAPGRPTTLGRWARPEELAGPRRSWPAGPAASSRGRCWSRALARVFRAVYGAKGQKAGWLTDAGTAGRMAVNPKSRPTKTRARRPNCSTSSM